MYHVYSEWKRVYCLFPKVTMHGEKLRGVLYRRILEVDDCGQHMTFTDYITEKEYFKLKLAGNHKGIQFA
jgi:hypothetical protein